MTRPVQPSGRGRHRVVIVGGGFAGLRVARSLAGAGVDITLVDRRNHHLFQPLLYQVACAGLSPDDIAVPLRHVLRDLPNVRTVMAEVASVDLAQRRLRFSGGGELGYDYLVLAAGAEPNYFGHPEWEAQAPSLKSLDAALRLRERFLLALERAERQRDEVARRRLLSFTVVGAGPTGVELAGGLAELARIAIRGEYRRVSPDEVRITLVEMGDRILPSFHPDSSSAAGRMLGELGVDIRLDTKVEQMAPGIIGHAHGGLATSTVCWASGVKPVGLAATVEAERDGRGRVQVVDDGSLPGHPEVFVLGDMACQTSDRYPDGLPALAAVAVQQGATAAKNIRRDLRRVPRRAFDYADRGTLATIGRGRAVADVGRFHLAGAGAWGLWSLVHIYQLIGMRNRVRVLMDWAWQYATPRRRAGARILTEREALAATVDRMPTVSSLPPLSAAPSRDGAATWKRAGQGG